MPNGWIKQAYVKVFDCKTITKISIIYLNASKFLKLFMKFFYNFPIKKTIRVDDNRDVHIRQRIGVYLLSKNYSDMGKHAGKRKKGYVDRPRDRSKLTCPIHGLGHYS